jgi:hypothetical protein
VKVQARSQRVQLTAIARAGADKPAAKPRQCRICLADETFSPVPHREGEVVSSLRKGICTDQAACQQRQPTLFQEGS